VGRRGCAPAPAFKRLTLSPQRHRGLRGQAGPRVGRSLVKHWPCRISRHCLVSTSTRAPVSSADAYLGSRSEPIQRLSVPERQRWRCMGPGWGTRHVGPVVVKPRAGTDWTAEPPPSLPPFSPPLSACLCAATVINGTHGLPEQQTDTASFSQCGRGQAERRCHPIRAWAQCCGDKEQGGAFHWCRGPLGQAPPPNPHTHTHTTRRGPLRCFVFSKKCHKKLSLIGAP